MLVVEIEVEPDYEADFNQWYDNEHVPELVALPGFVSAQRYRLLSDSCTYLALYELEYPSAATSHEYMSRAASEWFLRLRPHWKLRKRSVWVLAAMAGSQMVVQLDE
jgi:hypothetical protein